MTRNDIFVLAGTLEVACILGILYAAGGCVFDKRCIDHYAKVGIASAVALILVVNVVHAIIHV